MRSIARARRSAAFILHGARPEGARLKDSGQCMVSQRLQHTLIRPPGSSGVVWAAAAVALTFDHGPDPEYTERTLEVC